ncbi:MAG: hypothetical protein U0936_03310 [Planctomycetaceae bacterium]
MSQTPEQDVHAVTPYGDGEPEIHCSLNLDDQFVASGGNRVDDPTRRLDLMRRAAGSVQSGLKISAIGQDSGDLEKNSRRIDSNIME